LILKKKIILASTSPYRAALLRRLALEFETANPGIDEAARSGELPGDTALRLACEKARSIGAAGALVIGSDQVAELNGSPIGKPGTRAHAREQLIAMRGRELVFHTGLAVCNVDSGDCRSLVVPTMVVMRNYADTEVDHYLDNEDALDCAGSAKAEGLGVALMSAMRSDDPTALIGLPLIALCHMLRQEGVEVLA
jgi:septum formation protein